ncbi:hypothetical protein CHUAL_004591 [Chamberlinius hualienensis]
MAAAEKVKKRSTKTGCLCAIKCCVARNYMRLCHRSQCLIQPCDLNSNDPFRSGAIANDEDEKLELPKNCADKNTVDIVKMFGTDVDGNLVYIRIERCHPAHVHADVQVRLSGDDRQFHLSPIAKNHIHCDCHGHVAFDDRTSFSSEGLLLEVLEPLRRWKISFDGFLTYDEAEMKNLIRVRFSFIWVPIHQPYDSKLYFNSNLLSDAIAQQPWSIDIWRKFKNPDTDWYDQWGSLLGAIQVDDNDNKTLKLRGKKLRQFGSIDYQELNNFVSIDIFIEDGTVVYFKNQSTNDLFNNYQTGYVLHCSDAYEEILTTNFSILNFVENRSLPANFEFFIKTKASKYSMIMTNLDKDFITYYGPNREIKSTVNTFHVNLGEYGGWALVESAFRNPEFVPLEMTKTDLQVPTETNLTVENFPTLLAAPLHSQYCLSVNVVGGKGIGLALMTALNSDNRFSVPRGICVTIQSYWRHLKENSSIVKSLEVVRNIAWQRVTGDLKTECEKLNNIFKCTELPVDIQKAIAKELETLFGSQFENMSFAVRSSAIGEDDKETSCAGQNDTFLGIKGTAELWKAVINCWASQFSFVAVEYKRQNGQLLDRGMGVVIQEMVNSSVAGVLFTADPVTGSSATLTLTANYGLGQSVVSSSVDPDSIVLDRKPGNGLVIRAKQLGKKATKDVLQSNGHTDSVMSTNEESNQFCLSDSQILLLGEIGLFIEQTLGHGQPVDIEWAFSDEKLYLLQTRAVTSLHQDSDFIVVHEFDSGFLTDKEILSTANIGEVLPGSLSPLTISTILNIFNVVFIERFMDMRPEICKNIYSKSMLHITGRRALGNFVNGSYCGALKEMTPMLKASGYGMIGKDIMSGAMHQTLLHRYGVMNYKGSWALAKPGFQYLLCHRRFERKTLKLMEMGNLHLKPNETLLEFHLRIIYLMKHLKRGMYSLMQGSTYSGMCATIILGILLHGQPDVTNEILSDYASLLGSDNDVISAGVPKTLKTLAQKLNAEEFLALNPKEAADWLVNNTDEPGEIYRNLLKEHGHRCYKEFDVRSKCWAEDQTLLTTMLQSALRSPTTTNTLNKETTIEETIANLTTPLSNKQKFLLRKVLPFCRKAVGAREKGKSICIQAVNLFRQSYRTLAKLMVSNGFTPDDDLPYFMTAREIDDLLKTRSPRILNRAKRRRNIHANLEKQRFPDFIIGYPEPIKELDTDIPRDSSSVICIKATTACQGYVRGKVRVVVHIEDAHQIQPSDILITYGTDIGWSPYFPLLAGIVTEIGGLISHGAVIAREYGLPCLIAAEDATKIFRSGDEVVLNATKGTIELISSNE